MVPDQGGAHSAAGGRRRGGNDEVSEARIRDRFRRLGPQSKAVGLALKPFEDDDGTFDREKWEAAFESPEPEDILAVTAVTGLYEGIVNHLIEMLQIGGALVRLDVSTGDERPKAPALIRAVRDDGGLSHDQADSLRLYRMRNKLQHTSLDVQADQIHDDIELLRRALGVFAKRYVKWLAEHGIELLPRSK